jgi:hypothetical protein
MEFASCAPKNRFCVRLNRRKVSLQVCRAGPTQKCGANRHGPDRGSERRRAVEAIWTLDPATRSHRLTASAVYGARRRQGRVPALLFMTISAREVNFSVPFVVLYGGEAVFVDQRAYLLIKAEKYRGYARWVGDSDTAGRILNLAFELEQQAMQPDEEDIRTRAYDLWKQAGEPEDRDDEFWLLAEQQLRNEDKSSTLRTPDNL